jgi:hypothetical protein
MRMSIAKLDERLFRLGSSTICEECEEPDSIKPSSILASWQDSGKTFIIRQQTAQKHGMTAGSSLDNLVHEAGT